MNKKGSSFYLLIVTLIVVFVMFFAIFKIIDKYKTISNNKEIGQRQNELFHIYQEGEKALLYIDQSGKLAAEQGIYDYAKNGGMGERKCGSYQGYAVWDFNSECSGNEKALPYFINENLNSYVDAYPDKEIHIPKDNYNYVLKNSDGKLTVVGLADDPLRIEVSR